MDRIQAQSFIGKLVSIDEGLAGSYLGILNEVMTPPRKTWRGIVTIQAVSDLPAFQNDDHTIQLPQLLYKENDIIECIGSKLSVAEADEGLIYSFEDSLTVAAELRFEELKNQITKTSLEQKALNTYLLENNLNVNLANTSFDLHSSEDQKDEESSTISYTFAKDKNRHYLIDDRNEQLDLEDCPFEFFWGNEQSYVGYYEENGVFISKDGIRFTPEVGTIFQISEKQFDPYYILQNELEPEALQSLEDYLHTFGLTHEHNIECHNTLLRQFLNANGQTNFNGVNFLTYQSKKGIVLVQHHFERKLHNHKNDEIYDRFEFTTEKGKRSIITFTNGFTK